MSYDEIDNRVEIGNLSIGKSHNCPGSIIYWDKNTSTYWIMMGYNGLEFFDSTMTDNTRSIYSVIGVDEI
jgi:hypothetical protein